LIPCAFGWLIDHSFSGFWQTWHDFDEQAWKKCKEDAGAARVPLSSRVQLLGNDIHEGALSLCARDAASAGVLDLLELSCQDCRVYSPPAIPSLVVTNPPWGSRLTDSRLFFRLAPSLRHELL